MNKVKFKLKNSFLSIMFPLLCVCLFCTAAKQVYAYQVPPDIELKIKNKIKGMSVKELYGQKFIIGTPWLYKNHSNTEIETSSRILHKLLLEYKIGNFVLSDINFRDWLSYTNNLDDKAQSKVSSNNIIKQIAETRQLMENHKMVIPPLFAADYEGGLVQHFRGEGLTTPTPSPMNFTATGDISKVYEFGKLTGQLYKKLGLTTNFAPLIDVNSETSLNVIGTRSYSSDPLTVISMASAFASGMQLQGVAPVIKHWPGLGNTPDTNGYWDVNIDIHEYTKPLTFNGSLGQYQPIYSQLLKQTQFNASGIMTAHVAVDSYRRLCQKGLNLVGFCRQIIDDGIRGSTKGLGAMNRVVISDDVAYLKATRSQFKNIPKAINDIFQSGHDLIIIGSLMPNHSITTVPCVKSTHPIDCKQNSPTPTAFLKGLDRFFEKKKNQPIDDDLIASVERILRWKYVTYRDLMGDKFDDKHWLEESFSYTPPIDLDLEHINKSIAELSNEVFKESVVIIHPAGYNAKTLSAELSVSSSKIYCVGPTFSFNDLEDVLHNELGQEGVNCNNLSYHPSQIKDKNFLDTNTNTIMSGIQAQDADLIIFGLVNKQKHIDVFVKVYNALRDEYNESATSLKPRKVLLVAFNSPGVIEEIHKRLNITEDLYILTTFSNSRESNRRVVSALLGHSKIQPIENLPISLKGYHGWVNILHSNTMANQIDQVNIDLSNQPATLIDKAYDVPIKNDIDYQKLVSAGIGMLVAFMLLFKINGINIWYSITSPVLGAYIFITIEKHEITAISPSELQVIESGGFSLNLEMLWPWIGTITCSVIIFLILTFFSFVIQTASKVIHSGATDPS